MCEPPHLASKLDFCCIYMYINTMTPCPHGYSRQVLYVSRPSALLIHYIKVLARCGGAQLLSHSSGSRGTRSSVSSSFTWSTQQAPVQLGLQKKTLSQTKQNKTKQCPKPNHPKPGTIDHLSMHQHTQQAHMGQGTDPLSAMFTQTLYMCPCTQAYTYSCTQQLCPYTPMYPGTTMHTAAMPTLSHISSIPTHKTSVPLLAQAQLCTLQPRSRMFHPMC